LGIAVRCGKQLATVSHVYTHFSITLYVYRCSIREGKPRALKCREVRWASPGELRRLPFSRVDRKVMEALSITAGPT
jgi:A/G-specific adenine glycosylase